MEGIFRATDGYLRIHAFCGQKAVPGFWGPVVMVASLRRFYDLVGDNAELFRQGCRFESPKGLEAIARLLEERRTLVILGPFGGTEPNRQILAGMLASRGAVIDDGFSDTKDMLKLAKERSPRLGGRRWVFLGPHMNPQVLIVGSKTPKGYSPGIPMTTEWRAFWNGVNMAGMYPEQISVIPHTKGPKCRLTKSDLRAIEPLGGILAVGWKARTRLKELEVEHDYCAFRNPEQIAKQLKDARRALPPPLL